jgi:hypothetical protein
MEEFNQALSDCRVQLVETLNSSAEVRDKLQKLVGSSHLKSLLSMVRDEQFIRQITKLV